MADEHQVLIFTLKDPTRAAGLADELRRDSAVQEAVVVERTTAGELRVVEGDTPADAGAGLAVGGVVGALLGVLGGPVGLLLGWGAGMLGGSAVDLAGVADDDDGLSVLAAGITAGSTVVIAEVVDATFPAEDRAIAYDAAVVRVPASEVASEVEDAEAAASAAQQAGREQRRAKRKSDFSARMHRFFDGSDQ